MNIKELIDELNVKSFTVSIEPESSTLADGYFINIGGDTYLVSSDGTIEFMEKVDPETGDWL